MNRFTPQEAFMPQASLSELSVTVIGVGAIGRQLSLQLASVGVQRLQLIDFDHVDATNVTTQGYYQSDIGLAKVEAVSRSAHRIDSAIEVTCVADRFRKRHKAATVVFCCVDKISARTAIWKTLRDQVQFWCDGRMLGEVIRVLTVDASQAENRRYYDQTLFTPAEAQQGGCTSRSTIYAASIAAGLMTQQFSRWLRKLPVDNDVTFNLLASELTVA